MTIESCPGGRVGEDGITNPSNIRVLVVGVGIGGLAAAIECHRKGHSVILVDKIAQVDPLAGDGIGIGTNGARIIAKWGGGRVHDQILSHRCDTRKIEILNRQGESFGQHELKGYGRDHGYMLNRGQLVSILFDYAGTLGIDKRLGSPVTEYRETEMGAAVVLEGGEVIEADCVICSDGVHGAGRKFVTSLDPVSRESGWAMSRAYLRKEDLKPHRDRDVRILDGTDKQDRMMVWFDHGIQVSMWTVKHGEELVWIVTHKVSVDLSLLPPPTLGTKDARDTWTMEGSESMIEDTISQIHDWPSRNMIEPILRSTPPKRLLNQKIITREPLDRWVSPHGRMIIIGDAAHPYPPISGQGGSQAIEDAAVVAIALQLAGKDHVPLALRIAEKIRSVTSHYLMLQGHHMLKSTGSHPRATAIQTEASHLYELMFKPDWGVVAKNPSILAPPCPKWLFQHDSQAYVYAEFGKIAEAMADGREYVIANTPPSA
ncbi:FAD dependent oxidoreductase [Aspergillus ustus]|uniref:Flavin-dependent monooxygenase pboD n=1 Tax=Aspergillus ustus TaxID=40382 RepID=PBOD_ASPUT|nr:RecName: Full=Flavin-dependent monooxygenase pboD; AltName: Full=Protubonine biosynthesis cluster protein D [Aspergillus ustus]KIA75845.1 FAD dependent oxidoreductase [Aspergillus ustus]